jgi:protein-tyrosine phosphatase
MSGVCAVSKIASDFFYNTVLAGNEGTQLILDSRSPQEFQEGHVRTSQNISEGGAGSPEKELTAFIESYYPGESFKVITIVCNERSNFETCGLAFLSVKGFPDGYGNFKMPQAIHLVDFESIKASFPFVLALGQSEQDVQSGGFYRWPSMILEWLFLGDKGSAGDRRVLEAIGISVVINVTIEVPCYFEGDHFEYLKLAVLDDEEQDMTETWRICCEALKNAKASGKKVLVHCSAGRSRSSSSVVYYLLATGECGGSSLDSILKFVKSKRNIVEPNDGFMEQLLTVERGLLATANEKL